MKLTDKIKELCKERGYDLQTLEIKAGLAQGNISHWKRHTPSLKSAFKICKVLGITIDELLLGVDIEN